jgi:hypothetical protein
MAAWLACLVVLPVAAAQALDGYRVAGIVVNAASGQPIGRASLNLTPIERDEQPLSTISGDDGRFAFMGLPSGKYQLAGQRRGFLAGNSSGAIVAGPDRNTENILLRLSPPGIISGKVVDDAGEPVAQALVELLGSRIVEGRRRLAAVSSQRTDDTGEYRFLSLAAGSYYLVASGVPWYTEFDETMGESASPNMTHTGYGVRYYPNADEPSAAQPLMLKPGHESTANFTLAPVPAVSVYVHCAPDDNLTIRYSLTAVGFPGNPVNIREGSESGDLYHFSGVPPGSYTFRAEATDGNHAWYGTSQFDVASADRDVSVTLRQAASLSGTIAAAGAGNLPPRLTVLLHDEIGNSVALPVDAGGRFSTLAIAPGRYGVSLAGAEEYFLKHEGQTVDIAAGPAVRLSLSVVPGVGRVAGKVYRDGAPLSSALVVLAPAGRAVQTNSDGSFEFRGLPVGEYALFAVDDGDDVEYANPAAVLPYLSAARKLHVVAGESDNVRLEAVPLRQ